ncbi:hypothetical protein RRG08_009528 [Elysia crispata]|uniref:Uncharacterized protein n=1 Tax=Elysia crispata TaxID=231223 RepID=A0AAE1B3E8_9GAST|nr:hypothetical protein RRG08_009528 [Elysia crispata]
MDKDAPFVSQPFCLWHVCGVTEEVNSRSRQVTSLVNHEHGAFPKTSSFGVDCLGKKAENLRPFCWTLCGGLNDLDLPICQEWLELTVSELWFY